MDESLGVSEVSWHWQLLSYGKKRCQLQGQHFRLKVLLLTFLLFYLLSLGNQMASVYTLVNRKAKRPAHTFLLSSRPGPCIKPAGHLHLDISWAPQTVVLAVLKLSTEKGAILPHSSCSKAPGWFVRLWPQAVVPFPSSNYSVLSPGAGPGTRTVWLSRHCCW